MDQQELDAQVRAMQEQYPAMFDHPERRENEIYIGDQLVDIVFLNVASYQRLGMPSARKGTAILKDMGDGRKFDYHPVFVDMGEYFKLKHEHEQLRA